MLFRKAGSLNAMAGVECGDSNSPESAELIACMSSLSASLCPDLQSLVDGELSILDNSLWLGFSLATICCPRSWITLRSICSFQLGTSTRPNVANIFPNVTQWASKEAEQSSALPQRPHKSVRDDRITRNRCTTKERGIRDPGLRRFLHTDCIEAVRLTFYLQMNNTVATTAPRPIGLLAQDMSSSSPVLAD